MHRVYVKATRAAKCLVAAIIATLVLVGSTGLPAALAQTTYNYTTDAAANWSAIQTGTPTAGDIVNLSANLTANRNITIDIAGATVGQLLMQDTVGVSNLWNITGANTLYFDNTGTTDAVLNVVNGSGTNYMRITAPVQLNDNLVINTYYSGASNTNRGRFDIDSNIAGGNKGITVSGVNDFNFDQATTAITNLASFTWNSSGDATLGAATATLANTSSGFTLAQGISGGAVTLAAPTTLAGALNVDANGYSQVAMSGQITGATDLVITGAGLQPKYMLSNNTEGGPGRRNVVAFTNATANSFTGSGSVSVTGAMLDLDFSNGVVAKVGSGALTLNAATLRVDDNASASTSQVFSSTTIGAGESNLVAKRDVNGNASTTTLALGGISRSTGGTAVFRYGLTTGGTNPGVIGTNTFITTTSSGLNGILGGWAVLATNGTNADDFAGIGTGGLIAAPGTNGATAYTTLTASNTGTGVENMSLSAAGLTRTANLGANSLRWINSSGTDSTMSLGTTTVTLASGGLLNANTGLNSSVTSLITGTGLISAADANADLFIYVRNNRLTIENPLIGAGTGALYKSGYGALTVTADAAYTGGTWLNGGTLNINGVNTRLSSGNLRLYQGAQLGTNGTFTRAIGAGNGEVSFGTGGGGFSAEGGDLTVNLGGAGATLTRTNVAGNLALNNAYTSTGVLTLVNPIDTTGGFTLSTGANASPGFGRFQSNYGTAYVKLQGSVTGPGDLQIFGGAANASNPNAGHQPSGLLYAPTNLQHTGKTLVNGTALYLDPSVLGTMNNIALSSGGQIATQGTRTFNLGGGPGEIQFLGQTFVNDGGFAAIGGDLTVTLYDGDTTISPSNSFAPQDFALGNAFSGYTTTLTNDLSPGGNNTTFTPTGPGLTVYSGAMSGSGAILSGGGNTSAGVLLVTGANTFTGNASIAFAGTIYRAGSPAALGASGGDNGANGTYDLNGYDFSGENFNGGGNSSGTFDLGRIINSNTASPASFGNLRVDNLFGGGTFFGGDGTLNFNNITTSAALTQSGIVRWAGTGTLNYNGNSTAVTYGGTNQQYRMGLQGGTVNFDYTTGTGAKLFGAVVGAPGVNPCLILTNVNWNLKGNATGAVTETVVDTGTIGGTSVDGGYSRVKLTTAGGNMTLNLNRLQSIARGAVDFATDTTLGGTATVTTDTTNNTAGILGGWVTWNKTDWAVNTTNLGDGPIGALASYTTDNNVGGWATGDPSPSPLLNRNIDGATSGTLGAHTRIGSLRFSPGGTNTTLTINSGVGLTLGAAAETGGLLVANGTTGNVTITGGAVNSGGANLGTIDTQGNTNLYIHQHGTGTLEIASKITGSSNAGLAKTGSGTLKLSGPNTYGAPTIIYGGTVEATTIVNSGTAQSLGKDANVQIFNGATLRLLNAADSVTNKRLQIGIGGGVLDLAGTGTTVTFSGQSTQLGAGFANTAVYRATDGEVPDFTITSAGNAVFNGGIYLSTPDKSGTSGGGNFGLNLVDQATLAKFTMNGTGTVTVNDRLIAQGGVVVNSGTLVLGHATDTLSNNVPLTVNTGGTVNLAAGKSDNMGQLYLKGGNITGAGTLRTLANFVESGSIAAVLGGELAGLDKTTIGTVTLTAANTYAGGTRIADGTLVAANASGSATGAGPVTLNGGTLASGTTGAIGGAVAAGSGTHTIAPGGLTSVGTLNLTKSGATLTISEITTLDFDITGATADLLAITGQLNIAPPPIAGMTPTIAVHPTGTLSGNYTLASFAASPITLTSFGTLPTVPGYNWDITSTYIKLVAAAGPLSPDSGTWKNGATGADKDKWTTNTLDGSNWSGGYPSAATHIATFDTTVTGTPGTVDLDGNKTVGKVLLDANTGQGYTLGLTSTTNTLTMDNGGSAAEVKTTSGAHTIRAKVIGVAGKTLNVSAATTGSLTLTEIENPATAVLALSRSGSGALDAGNVVNAGTMSVAGTVSAKAISGGGTTNVTGSLTANSIVQDTLTIGAGGSVTIRAVPVAADAAGSANAVPEPGTWVLIGTALVGWLAVRRRRSR